MYFYPDVLKYLHEAGWYTGRKYNIELIKEHLLKRGYAPNDIVVDFLSEFGDLTIRFPFINFNTGEKQESNINDMHFNVINSVNNIARQNVSLYEERCNEILVVIGEAFRGHITLMMSHKGTFYGSYDELLYYIGENKYESINKIILTERFREIE